MACSVKYMEQFEGFQYACESRQSCLFQAADAEWLLGGLALILFHLSIYLAAATLVS